MVWLMVFLYILEAAVLGGCIILGIDDALYGSPGQLLQDVLVACVVSIGIVLTAAVHILCVPFKPEEGP